MAKKKYIYHEGDKAQRNFDRGMKAICRVPKQTIAERENLMPIRGLSRAQPRDLGVASAAGC